MQIVTWEGQVTALSSIAHAGETRGTITLLRRETVVTSDGALVEIPVISGNTFRGKLRRIGEELIREVLQYEGELHPAVAHALRGGGSLAKASREPLSGSRLQQLRRLVPLIAVFGAAGGGRIIDGCLQVGKVVPVIAETARITGIAAKVTAMECTQLETFARQDDSDTHGFSGVVDHSDGVGGVEQQMQFRLETFPAGTRFHTWLRLDQPTEGELAFMVEVLNRFAEVGRLGGRAGMGMGRVQLALDPQPAVDRSDLVDWRAELAEHRAEALEALDGLR